MWDGGPWPTARKQRQESGDPAAEPSPVRSLATLTECRPAGRWFRWPRPAFASATFSLDEVDNTGSPSWPSRTSCFELCASR